MADQATMAEVAIAFTVMLIAAAVAIRAAGLAVPRRRSRRAARRAAAAAAPAEMLEEEDPLEVIGVGRPEEGRRGRRILSSFGLIFTIAFLGAVIGVTLLLIGRGIVMIFHQLGGVD